MAAFTAHVTIHVHEFSPQILPTLTGMSMKHEIGGVSVSFEFSCRQPPDCAEALPAFLAPARD